MVSIFMIKIIILVFILIAAGLLHLLDPFSLVNALPLFIPFKLEIIFWTGIFEFILAAGILIPKTRSIFAKLCALYFLVLVPIHIYVSWNTVPIFGVKDPFLLWARTLFQAVLIRWAWSLRKI
jgi:uncharacterized membrane protein